MRRAAPLLVLVWLSAFSGCFQAIKSYRQSRVCTPQAAERAGTKDARFGRPLNEKYAAICDGVAESSLNRAYRDAYDRVPAGERRKRGLFERIFSS